MKREPKPHLYTVHGVWYCRVILSNGAVHQAWGVGWRTAWDRLQAMLEGRP